MVANRSDLIYESLASTMGTSSLAVLHSAIYRFGMHPSGLREDLLSALFRLADGGMTLVLPAFTFSFCKNARYHHRDSPSESGLLADWILEEGGAKRTPHPVYSFAVIGPLQEECCAWRDLGAFGDGTLFELFEKENARIVFAGATWQSCTQIHRYEELSRVPYRYRKEFTGTADFGGGAMRVSAQLCVRDVALNSALNYSLVFDRLRVEGRIAERKLERGPIESVSCADVALASMELLREDPFGVLEDPRVIEERLVVRGGARD